jgi:radical SAM superfamily enzyme YgiQ (UPF0313 family)
MIGLPGETDADLDAIADLANAISLSGLDVDGKRRNVTLSINTFVPKPHTAFQWAQMVGVEEALNKQRYLRQKLYSKKFKVDFNDVRISVIEAMLSRGDASLGEIIYEAWKKGAKLEAWRELFNFSLWEGLFTARGRSVCAYAAREFRASDDLPWDMIDPGISKEHFLNEYKLSKPV